MAFTQQTSDFLWDLAFHNERPWFMEHKETFMEVLKNPFDEVAKETFAGLQQRFPEEEFQLHISRIYRDARRLHGRGPYKDHLWFSIWTGYSKHDNPAFFFELSASSYSYGVGFWPMHAEQMENYRAAIDANPSKMERLAKTIQNQDWFVLYGDEYKKSKGDRGELLNPWYNKRHIGLHCAHDFGGEILQDNLPKRLADGYEFLMPYYKFLYQFRQPD